MSLDGVVRSVSFNIVVGKIAFNIVVGKIAFIVVVGTSPINSLCNSCKDYQAIYNITLYFLSLSFLCSLKQRVT